MDTKQSPSTKSEPKKATGMFSDPSTGKSYKSAAALKTAITKRKNAEEARKNINEPRFPTVSDPDNLDPDIQIHDSLEAIPASQLVDGPPPSAELTTVIPPSQQKSKPFGDLATVEMNPDCIPFIPGTNKLGILMDWCKTNCTGEYRTMGKSGMNWIFTDQADADAFTEAWNIRSTRKVKKEDDE